MKGLKIFLVIVHHVQAKQTKPAVVIPQWPRNTPMPTARYSFAAALGTDGKIYTFGGFTPGNIPNATTEVYDPATNSWTPQN